METVDQLVSFVHIQIHLSGGAPWGFTLKGGLEHGEPLIITKIEDGGKAALCEKLRVGDELININGTVLYGSRQEALILIKGSYRVLKLTVRRRSVPVLRPHSWHLEQIPEPALPPPPPPSPPCLPPVDSPPLPPPPPPSAMQLHPGSYSLPWHTSDHSDLSMQWGQLSRPYSSTDRSSSLGSMESLDTPTPTAQTNYDSHNSPVDPALFNNKRDSAYSSFSASSNTSDYATVPLRFGEGSSMENLLQNLGTSGDATGQVLDNGQLIMLKSRSLTRPRTKNIDVKARPSSCCYEDERKVDDFKILRNGNDDSTRKSNPPQPPTRKDSFRATKSRPNVTSSRCASAPIEIANSPSYIDDSARKSVQNGFSVAEDEKKDSLESYFIRKKAPLTCCKSNAETSIYRPQNKHSTNVLHRHSAPEKLLATQLQLLQFDSNGVPIEPFIPPKSTNLSSSSSSQWSQSEKDQDSLYNHLQTPSNKWGGSRCSTPGSVFLEDGGEECNFSHEPSMVNGGTTSPSQVPWGRSVSVPDEPLTLSIHKHNLDQVNERDFEPLSSASSVDTLVEKKCEISEGESTVLKKSSRNLRKNRRRNERFATNLRNEIQRKKAQLQSGRSGPGGLLCSGETVHEEGPDFHEDAELEVPERKAKGAFAPTTATAITPTQDPTTAASSSVDSNSNVMPIQQSTNRSVQIVDPGVPSFGVGIRVVEEPAPAGKARRWRWTPEHKLQLESEPQSKGNGEKLLGSSRHGVCAFTSSFTSSSTSSHPRSMSCSRMDESDLLPFADRMKFFEETSKTGVAKSPQSQAKQKLYQSENQAGDLGYQTQRRYSYQGGFKQDSLMEARRQSVSAKEREDRLKQREIERQVREREKEERMRQWERDREIERQEELERLREMDRRKQEKEEMEMREEYFAQKSRESHQGYHQHRDHFSSFQPSMHGFEQRQVSRSAFYPVNGPSQHFDNSQQHQRFPDRSPTPTEMYPARQQETTKLNRKYSLTERDYSSRRWESRPMDPPQFHQSRWMHRPHDHAHSNGYSSAPPPAPLRARAMSENDLRFDSTHRWSPSLSLASSQTLSEVEESENVREKPLRKKMPPPPRPPPPKWEQFHKRRASHHAVYSSSVPQTVTGDYSIQSSFGGETSRQRSYSLPPQRQDLSTTTAPCPTCSCHQTPPQDPPTHHPSPRQPPPPYQAQRSPPTLRDQTQPSDDVQLSRQILPPNNPPSHVQPSHYKQPPYAPPNDPLPADAPPPPPRPSSSQGPPQLPVFSVAPPSPMFSRRAFRPVAPPQRSSRESASEEAEEFPPPPPPVADDIEDSVSDSEIGQIREQDQVQSAKRRTVKWERTPSPTIHSKSISPPPPPPPPPSLPAPEPFHSIHFQQKHNLEAEFETSDNSNEQKSLETEESETTLSPSPAQSLEADLDVPLETDIDDFQEEELPATGELTAKMHIDSELTCLALPVTVLETDLDLLPDRESSPLGKTQPESSLLGEEELEVQEEEEEEEEEEEGSLEEIFPQSSEGESGTESWRGASQNTEHNTDSLDRRSGASSSCSSYYSTSTAKAQLLTQMKDFTENRDRIDHDELTYKRQLMESLRKKLGVLREAQRGLQDDIRANTQLGDEVEAMVLSVCKPNEVDKFRMFIGDLDKVVSLLLSLSGRLLRVETTLDTLDPEADHEERLPLLEKKRQLMRQLSEAQDLKEHVDRREQAVSRVLGRCLTPEQHRDYSHFVKMKAALLVEQRQLEDKIRLGEEQLRGLRESLGLGLGMGMGLAMGYGQY